MTNPMKNNRARWWPILLAILMLQSPAAAGADEITVAAAADLTFAFQQVAAKFEKETGNTVRLSFGSSGNFFSQIENRAPYDLFFSADLSYPKKLEAAGLAEPGSLYEYATGKLVLWVPDGSQLDLNKGLRVLLDPRIGKIAIANPEYAPYGRAAMAALRHEKIYAEIKSKLVLGENIAQTAQFVQSRSADVGILALSLALAPTLRSEGRYVEIAPADYSPIVQAGVILRTSGKKKAAREFLAFLQTPQIVELMRRYGFVVPKKAGQAATGAVTH
jgi:molybdate transport system substrate-binding protein